jgi:hypothetical protein
MEETAIPHGCLWLIVNSCLIVMILMWLDWLTDCCYIASDWYHFGQSLSTPLVYISSITCCLRWQVKSPLSLGTIVRFFVCSRKLDFMVEPLSSYLFRQVGLVTCIIIPDLALIRMTESLCPSLVRDFVLHVRNIVKREEGWHVPTAGQCIKGMAILCWVSEKV